MPAPSESGAGPRRTCVGCRQVRPADELVRVRRRQDGSLAVGPGPGRGAWLCQDRPECLDRAWRRKAFERALRSPVAAGAVEELRTKLTGRASMEAWPSPDAPVPRPVASRSAPR